MKPFQIAPAIAEYADFGQFAEAEGLNEKDLILTNEYIYKPSIAPYNVSCIPLFQEKYGAGEPSDVMELTVNEPEAMVTASSFIEEKVVMNRPGKRIKATACTQCLAI